MTTQTKDRPKIRRGKGESNVSALVTAGNYKAPGRLPSKRRLALALVLCLAIVGGLVAYSAANGQSGHKVLVFSGDVKRGEKITADKINSFLTVTDIPQGALTVEQSAEAIDKYATVDLKAGGLVLGNEFAPELGLAPGSSIVGVAVQPSQLPLRDLIAGDRVRVVFTPSDAAANAQGTEQSVSGTVDRVRPDDGKGFAIVDVKLSTSDAPKAARWSSAKAASIVLDGGK